MNKVVYNPTDGAKLKNKFDTTYIRKTIDLINKDLLTYKKVSQTETELYITTLYPEFHDKYPSILKKICKGDNIDFLYKMLDNLENVENNTSKLSEVEHTLGEELANKYLYSNIK